MTCPSELTLAMYADGELTDGEVAATDSHLEACPACRARLAALRIETGSLLAALAADAVPAGDLAMPAFRTPASGNAVAAGAALVFLGALLASLAPGLIVSAIPAPIAWFNPFDARGLAEFTARAAFFIAEHGAAALTTLGEAVAALVIAAFLSWAIFGSGRHRAGPFIMISLICTFIAVSPAQALEIRTDETEHVLIPAGETIADTLIAAGETVEIAGDVEGDLIAVGRRVVIRGRVEGQLITGAENVTIGGEVGGSVIGFGRTVNVSSPRIGRNFYGFGSTVNGDRTMDIEQNAVVFGQQVSLAGPIGRDVVAVGEELEVGNAIGGALTAYGRRVTLLTDARVAGDVTAHVPNEENLTVSSGAVVGGKLTTDLIEARERPSKYATLGFYVSQILRLAAAFLAGVILLFLLPGLRGASLPGAGATLVAAGTGLVTLVATPIVALIIAITIIGIPVAVLGLLLWIAGLYLAKVIIAYLIGARLVEASGKTRHFAVALAVGLLAVMIIVNLPFIGGAINFLLTICGLGLLVIITWDAFRGEREVPGTT